MTKWPYMVVFNELLASREAIQKSLDQMTDVTYWYSCLPHCVFFVSSATAQTLADRFRAKFGTGAGKRFMVCEVHTDRQGWLPKEAWHLFNNVDDPRLKA